MEKRGISPLIAIVVLIAFLVVLSVLIFTFVRQFTFERIEGAEREKLEYEATIETAFDINFATITRVPGNLAFRVGVENTGKNDIIGFKVRSYGTLGIEATDIDADLTFFNKKTVLVIPFPNVGKIQSVELIPEIILNGEEFIVFESRRETGVNDVCSVSEDGLLCGDGIDNDCDGLIDQNDDECQGGQQCNNDGDCDPWEDSSCADCQQGVCDNDNICEQDENLDNCPNDCRSEPVCNNNGICELGESFGRCGGSDCARTKNLEETGWRFICNDLRKPRGSRTINCDTFEFGVPYMFKNSEIGEGQMLEMKGHPVLDFVAEKEFAIKSDTKYKVSAMFKTKDRALSNMIDYGFADEFKGYSGFFEGMSCGRNDLGVALANNAGKYSSLALVSPHIIFDGVLECVKDQDWFKVEGTFTSPANINRAFFSIKLIWFNGTFLLDNIELEEFDDTNLNDGVVLPDTVLFGGMRVESANDFGNAIEVETTAAKFIFDKVGNKIDAYSKIPNEQLLSVVLFDQGMFNQLQIVRDTNENVLLESRDFQGAIYQDSTMLFRSLRDGQYVVNGKFDPAYSLLRLGHAFASSGENGILVVPIAEGLDGAFVGDISDQFHDPTFYKNRLFNDFITGSTGIFGNDWRITYDLPVGKKYALQVFPPRAYDVDYACKMQWGNSVTFIEEDDFTRDAARFHKIRNMWQYPWLYMPYNPSGPYAFNPNNINEIQSKVNIMHDVGMQVTSYTSPYYYYTTDMNIFLNNVQQLINRVGLDGVYYDGIYDFDFLKSWIFLRETRKLLGNKILIQHSSFLPPDRQADFRFPMIDAYADILFIGESVSTQSENDPRWTYNFKGEGLNNVPTYVLLFDQRKKSTGGAMNDKEQIDKIVDIGSFYKYTNRFGGTGIYTFQLDDNGEYYFRQKAPICAQETCGDGVCDIFESDPVDNVGYCSADCL